MRHQSTPFVKIPLTQGKVALVSPEDAERVLRHRWFAYRGRHGWYARRSVWVNGTNKSVLLHREVTGDWQAPNVDHRNGNGLDNRRGNLRPANDAQNAANERGWKPGKSGYRGVSFCDRTGKWRADCRGGPSNLGRFDTPEEAARAYDRAASARYGDFSRLNFSEGRPGERGD